MSKMLMTELRSFAETTSVRGIPRVMKAKTRVTFVGWLVAVLTCAALLVWQLSAVLTRYFQYPVSTLTVQAPAWQNPTFPDVTICNLDPTIYPDTNANWITSDVNVLIASINQSFSYTMNESPIINASYYEWFLINSFPVQISAAWDPWYYKCFTFRPLNTGREYIQGLYLTLYVDQVKGGPIGYSSYYSTDGAYAAKGLSLVVHAPGTAPDSSVSMNIAPGTQTVILITQSVRTRLGQPYSNCTDQQHLPWDNTSDVYTQSYCVNTCIQQKIVDKFGCVTMWLPQYTMAQLREANFQICEIIAANSTEIDNGFSASMYYNTSAQDCIASCRLPCSEVQYDTSTSVAPWPSSAQLNTCSYQYLSDPRFLHLFNTNENATYEEICTATTTKAATDFLESRFLDLYVQFSDQSFVNLKDVAAFSVDAMGAQIGGVLSLWLGVTVMFAFELFEFLYVYLTNSCKKDHTKIGPTSAAPSAETERSQIVVVQIE